MTVQFDIQWLIGTVLFIVGSFYGLAKMMLSQSQRHIDAQFKQITDTLKGQDDGARRLERELMDLRAELPREYVRRGDHDRVIASLHVSIDNLRLTIERAILQRGQQQ